MRTWWIITGLLAAFNILLAITWYQKSQHLSEADRLLRILPPPEEYDYRSEYIARDFEYYGQSRPAYRAYAIANTRFAEALAEWDKGIQRVEGHLFDIEPGPPAAVQEKLWSAFREYRSAVDALVESAVPERRKIYSDYTLASRLIRRRRAAADLKAGRYIEQQVDSVINRYGTTAGYFIRDQAENAFLQYLEDRSDPAVEHRTISLAGRLDNLMLSPGTMNWYGTVYKLDHLSAAQQIGLCRQARMLKGKLDIQLQKLVKP